ncbi:antibiotic biosynthesis monooxygenase [Cohaesibacter sp. CAU 1516]|uniref:antibiotic biosynthesis monooxygenase family protein n=1 Tax=Cohaesibacter sp. CAU 1516 TaxID=2576038 RepID=UPI0010FDDA72|nr:antibiotic biosynthesis monooxygenase [Cohaesibacter sp. CAU 1516]TLP44282.1 antibiotic biosynthesis monooxygenase [Cohaesibacter sp. CAU 1516]
MIAVIFEVYVTEGRKADYLTIAAAIRPMLEQIDGFLSVERFQSLTEPNKMLSLSFFEHEDAITQWRNFATHRQAQDKGRAEGHDAVFDDYRLRVANVLRDYGKFDRQQAPKDSEEKD